MAEEGKEAKEAYVSDESEDDTGEDDDIGDGIADMKVDMPQMVSKGRRNTVVAPACIVEADWKPPVFAKDEADVEVLSGYLKNLLLFAE